jgi:hypothetical protein
LIVSHSLKIHLTPSIMTDAPPQLGELPKTSEFRVPTLSSTTEQETAPDTTANGSAKMNGTKDTLTGVKDSAISSEVSFSS